jgi:hypothetical protein
MAWPRRSMFGGVSVRCSVCSDFGDAVRDEDSSTTALSAANAATRAGGRFCHSVIPSITRSVIVEMVCFETVLVS